MAESLRTALDVDAAFVGEGAEADERLIAAHRQVGQFGDVAGDGGEGGELLAADGGVAELEFEIGDDGAEIGVAAALAIAVDAALDVRAARLDRGDGVGDGDVGIVMGMDADDAVEASGGLRRRLRRGGAVRCAAVGVAEAEDVGAGFLGGFERAQGELGIVLVAVEEMLGVVDHFAAVVFEIADGFGDELADSLLR